jgi:predicted nuclease of predicted toxin-antitoxin system
VRLLFDQNLSRHLVGHLRDVFPESEHVTALGLDAATDQEIWRYAGEHGHLIVSKDSDFRQLAFLHSPPPMAESRQRFDGDNPPGAARPRRSHRSVLGHRG